MTIRALRFARATLIALALLWYPVNSSAANDGSENLILVTLDGVRWQEVFGGVEPAPDGLQESNEIWLAAIGSCIKPAGLVKGHWKQSQIAATALLCLKLDAARLMPEADSAITRILN